jgi:signal transduction histidine kinase
MKAVPGGKIGSIADVVDEGLALCRDGRIWWASDRMAVLLGCDSPDALIGESISQRLWDSGQGLPQLDGPGVPCSVRDSSASSRSLIVRRISVRSGELWLAGCADEPSSNTALTAFTHRALKQANREVTRLREELSRQGKEREEFLAVLGHELRTPITVIAGYSRLLLSPEVGALNEAQERYLKETRKSCRRLDELVESLLEIFSQGMLEYNLDLVPRSLTSAISAACESLEPLLQAKRLRFRIVPPDADADWAIFDSARLGQVLVNLLDNAIGFSEVGGEIIIGVRQGDGPDKDHVKVFVEDSGPGIPVSQRHRIFEPYVRIDAKPDRPGLGLGLAICKRVVNAHGGKIWVEGGSAGGCRFEFTLPGEEFQVEAEEEEEKNG